MSYLFPKQNGELPVSDNKSGGKGAFKNRVGEFDLTSEMYVFREGSKGHIKHKEDK